MLVGILVCLFGFIFGLCGLIFISTFGFALIASIMNVFYDKGGENSIWVIYLTKKFTITILKT